MSRVWKIALVFFLPVFLYIFASYRSNSRQIKSVEINYRQPYHFIDQDKIKDIVLQGVNPNIEINRSDINLREIEQRLNSNDFILNSEVYITLDGILKVDIDQKRPIGRVLSSKGGYYIDSEGGVMPLSKIYSERVPVVTGEITSKNRADLYFLLKRIDSDPYLQQCVVGVGARGSRFSFFVRTGDFEIILGGVDDFDKKINNFKSFYKKIIKDKLFDRYQRVNLEISNQVIGVKKT